VFGVVAVGAMLPQSSLNETLGFAPLPIGFFAMLIGFVVAYLIAVEVAKYLFFRSRTITAPQPLGRGHAHRIHRIAFRWSHHDPLVPEQSGSSPQALPAHS
jgi:Mg2+-importing ATPase